MELRERNKLVNLSSHALSIGRSVMIACVARVSAFTTILFRGLHNVFVVGPSHEMPVMHSIKLHLIFVHIFILLSFLYKKIYKKSV